MSEQTNVCSEETDKQEKDLSSNKRELPNDMEQQKMSGKNSVNFAEMGMKRTRRKHTIGQELANLSVKRTYFVACAHALVELEQKYKTFFLYT